jgi:hypothetical protein
LAFLIAACAQPVGADITKGEVTEVQSTAQLVSAVVVLRRTGGFAGVNDEYTIYTDGNISLPKGKETQVSSEDVVQLLDKIQELGFFEMEASYGKLSKCNDCFNYSLSVDWDGQQKTVTAVETADDVPAEYWQIVELVTAFE